MTLLNILIFTGAGISRESGLKTFRDQDGLWEGYSVEDVCTTRAWAKQPEVVLDFYNARRRECLEAQPNAAHRALAGLEGHGDNVSIVTQNIDDLHERAGSQKVLHLHGEITKMRSAGNPPTLRDCPGDIQIGDLCDEGQQLRPHVVFFGEGIYNYEEAMDLTRQADVLIVVGTSLYVTPASYIVSATMAHHLYMVDPRRPSLMGPQWDSIRGGVEFIEAPATEGVREAINRLRRDFPRP